MCIHVNVHKYIHTQYMVDDVVGGHKPIYMYCIYTRHICKYVHIYIYIRITYVHNYTYIYINTYMYTSTYVLHMYINTYICRNCWEGIHHIFAGNMYMYTYIHIYKCTYVHMYIYMRYVVGELLGVLTTRIRAVIYMSTATRTATHCNANCNTLQRELQHTATRIAIHCNTLQHTWNAQKPQQR